MHIPTGSRAARLLTLAALLSVTAAPARAVDPQQAAVVILKDGFALRGFIRQDQEIVVDSYSRGMESIPKGFYYLDDRCRHIFFSHHYVSDAPKRPFDPGQEFLLPKAPANVLPVPPIRQVIEAGAWNDDWERAVKLRGPDGGRLVLTQHILALTPHFTWCAATAKNYNKYRWTCGYRTSELGYEAVAALLAAHPDLKDKPDKPKPKDEPKGKAKKDEKKDGKKDEKKDDPKSAEEQRVQRRFQVFHFYVRAGWMHEAEQELERIGKDFPKEKEKVATAEENLRKVLAFRRWDEAKLAQAAGRHLAARGLLTLFPKDGADAKLLADVRALSDAYATAEGSMKRARERLTALVADLRDGDERQFFAEAAAAIAAELNFDHFLKDDKADRGRLEPFLGQAERAEQAAKDGKKAAPARELLSLAVTGWLLGAAAAEDKPAAAARLWQARRFLLAFQKTSNANTRGQMLTDFERATGARVDETMRLIANLPPVEPEPGAGTLPMTLKTGKQVYQAQLPPEYHPGRPYPVLVALHHAGEGGKDMLDRWGEQAARHGYILVAPEWGSGAQAPYSYTTDEHAPVLDTLRDLGRRFAVDTDRVFLTGFAEGANMAYDVGLAHPDLFAGVLPIAGQPRYHALKYWQNGQYLPFYAVWGERMGLPDDAQPKDVKSDGNRANYDLFKDWIPYGFPMLGIQYQGRGREWFGGEVPDAFDWMSRKRRANPVTTLGRDGLGSDTGGTEFRTLRRADNRFYWLGTDDILPGSLNDGRDPRAWNWSRKPAMLAGQVTTEGNIIHVRALGVRQVSIWLTRSMVDFDKPLTIRFNGRDHAQGMARKLTPSLATLLEEFYQRGDRQRLYVARLDFRL